MVQYMKNHVWAGVGNCFCAYKCCFGVYFPSSRSNKWNWHQNNLGECINSLSQQYIDYFIIYMTQWPIHDVPNYHLRTLTLCLTQSVYILVMTSQSTVQCIMGSGNCDASTWDVISTLIDINFIHVRKPGMKAYKEQYRYNAVNFIQNTHKRHPIACPLRRKIWVSFESSKSDLCFVVVITFFNVVC